MVRPSSTPLFFGSFTWNVPLLGTTDSVEQTHEGLKAPTLTFDLRHIEHMHVSGR